MTSALFNREGTSPRTTFPIPHVQSPSMDHCPVDLHRYYLSSDYLMSSDTTYSPTIIFGPFIPTIIILINCMLFFFKIISFLY